MIKQALVIGALALGLAGCQSAPDSQAQIELQGNWHVESAMGKPVIDYSPAQLNFEADGNLTGNNSCNNFFGQYSINGDQVKLMPAGNTMKACVEALMAQEQRVMQAMPEVTTAKMVQGKLELNNAAGKTVLVLSRI
ncbi:META domain-containing protein [Shewanella marina]|uniref:META domain-containing protein n=1 Tax=Shewanella marina TaxID=487319 RepID=UPI000470314E|nr:META domain-containing protein [Shewanella marina]